MLSIMMPQEIWTGNLIGASTDAYLLKDSMQRIDANQGMVNTFTRNAISKSQKHASKHSYTSPPEMAMEMQNENI